MMSNRRTAALLTLLVVVAGCASGTDSKPTWSEASNADIPAYTTFAWKEGELPATILDNQIRDAIRAGLLAKGYVESSDTPDFLVDYESIERDAVEQGNPVRIGIGVGTWGGNVGGRVGTSVDVGEKDRVVEQLRVTIRALDPRQRREVWVGTTVPMSARPETNVLNRAVSEVMAKFPNKRR